MPIASTQINATALIGWTCLGLGTVSFITVLALYLFQRSKVKRWQNQNGQIIINVTPSSHY